MRASSPPLPSGHFATRDGTRLAFREVGSGRPLVLLHGYFSTATVNWIRFGHAARVAERGFRVVMPDLRAHGDSGKPHDPAAYPPDVLADDGFALIEHLGLTDYDLGGYSLGAWTVVRMLDRGARPARAVVAGTGIDGIVDPSGRSAHFRTVLGDPGQFPAGSPEALARGFLRTVGGDPAALVRVLDTFVGTPREALARIALPVLVLAGQADHDTGSVEALAAAIPGSRLAFVPGDHMSAVAKPDLGAAIAAFLTE